MSDDATFRNLIRLRNFLQSKGWDEDADVANKVADRIEALEARLGALCSYPLCDCKGSECQVIDGPVPEVCARSDLIEVRKAALEEAAQRVEQYDQLLIFDPIRYRHDNIRDSVAKAIRALAESEKS